jgi:hypothetical protein
VTIATNPISGLITLVPEERGENWIRYRLVKDASGLIWTNGAATIQVEGGKAILSGSGEVRSHIAHALKLK